MATSNYTVGQIQGLIDDIVNQVAQNNGFNSSQLSELLVAAQGTAFVESSDNPTAFAQVPNSTSAVYGLYQAEVPNGLGAAYASDPQALFDPNINANLGINNLAKTILANPQITDPGTIAAMAQRPYMPTDPRYAQYANSVDQNGQSIVGGNSPVSTATTVGGNIPVGSVPYSASSSSGFKWWSPSSWGNATIFEYTRYSFGFAGIVLIIMGLLVFFKQAKSDNIVIQGAPSNGNTMPTPQKDTTVGAGKPRESTTKKVAKDGAKVAAAGAAAAE